MKKYRIKLGNMYLKSFEYTYGKYSDGSRYIEFAENEYYSFDKKEDTVLIEQLINMILGIQIVVEEYEEEDE